MKLSLKLPEQFDEAPIEFTCGEIFSWCQREFCCVHIVITLIYYLTDSARGQDKRNAVF